jgi:hypothetical protein
VLTAEPPTVHCQHKGSSHSDRVELEALEP